MEECINIGERDSTVVPVQPRSTIYTFPFFAAK